MAKKKTKQPTKTPIEIKPAVLEVSTLNISDKIKDILGSISVAEDNLEEIISNQIRQYAVSQERAGIFTLNTQLRDAKQLVTLLEARIAYYSVVNNVK